MKKAIISGSTGLVGIAVTRHLCSRKIQLLCLGRKNLSSDQVSELFGFNVLYIPVPMSQISSLPQEARSRGWELDEDTVFYNFAWSGEKGLTDGDCGNQIANAISAAEAVKIAKIMRCSKFINSGSMEETFIEDYLNGGRARVYHSSQTYYGLAKLASRNMCTVTSYLEGIDYVHTRMSVPLAPDLSKGGYIASTLRKIFRDEDYDPPITETLYDIVLLDDVARAYYLIGMRGHNKADYLIGSGKPSTLRQYFETFSRLCQGNPAEEVEIASNSDSKLFDIRTLEKDTGWTTSQSLDQILSNLRGS